MNQFLIIRGDEKDISKLKNIAKELKSLSLIQTIQPKDKSYESEFLNLLTKDKMNDNLQD